MKSTERIAKEVGASHFSGEVIGGRWRVTDLLGQGGFGQVFRCVDESDIGLGSAAVKMLHPNTSPHERNEFLTEVQKMASLRHQNLVGYLDSGVHTDGDLIHPFLVTELCDGSLADHLARLPGRRMDLRDALAALGEMAAGLEHLHARSLIHRDLKPGNVLFGDGAWKLGDFGLMRDLTATGSYHRGEDVTGTPMFMAPELFTTMTATAPSDVYALGVMAHVMVAGRAVHHGSGPALLHAAANLTPDIDAAIEPGFRQLIIDSVARDPRHRPTAAQFRERLEMLKSSPQPGGALPGWQDPAARPISGPQGPDGTTVPANFGPGPGPPQVPSNQQMQAPQQMPANQQMPVSQRPSGPSGAGYHHAPYPVAAAHPGQDSPAASRSTGWLIAVMAALLGLAAVVVVAAAAIYVALARDGGAESAEQLEAGADQPTPADDETEQSVATTVDGVVIGEGVEIGDGVVIGGDTPTDDADTDGSATDSEVPNPEEHLDHQPCENGPEDQVIITNRFDQFVDYRLDVNYFDAGGARVSEEWAMAQALAPGEQASVGLASSEDSAVSCTLVTYQAVVTPPAVLDQRAWVDELSCEPTFARHLAEFVITNPLDVAVTAEVYVAVIDANGVRLDEDWAGRTVFDIGPGEAVREEASIVFWNLDDLGSPPVDCEIIAVEYDIY